MSSIGLNCVLSKGIVRLMYRAVVSNSRPSYDISIMGLPGGVGRLAPPSTQYSIIRRADIACARCSARAAQTMAGESVELFDGVVFRTMFRLAALPDRDVCCCFCFLQLEA
jgi:hypothetical protein